MYGLVYGIFCADVAPFIDCVHSTEDTQGIQKEKRKYPTIPKGSEGTYSVDAYAHHWCPQRDYDTRSLVDS
jgi:hypothetical protein